MLILKKKSSVLNTLYLNAKGCQEARQITQHNTVPKPIIPPFQYSNIPIVSEAN